MFEDYRLNKKVSQIRENFLFSVFEYGRPSCLTALGKTASNEEIGFANNLASACSQILLGENNIIKSEKTRKQLLRIFDSALSFVGEQKYLAMYNDLLKDDVAVLDFPTDRSLPLYANIDDKTKFVDKYGWISNPKIFKGSILSQKRKYFDAVKAVASDGICAKPVDEIIRDCAKSFNAKTAGERAGLNRAILANIDKLISSVNQKIALEEIALNNSADCSETSAEK